MPQPWSKPLDFDRLCRGEAELDFDIALAALARLRSRAANIEGSVRGSVRFGRHSGTAVVDVSLEGLAVLQCQRCMQPMEVPLRATVRVALLLCAADADRIPEEFEPMLAPEGRISVGELVEEELLLTLPIVPLHEPIEQCPAQSNAPLGADEPREQTTQRPFERLGELLNHK